MENNEKLIRSTTTELAKAFKIEYNYGSKYSLWTCGLNTGLVSDELYNEARKYYGRGWNYVGD